MDPLTAGLVTAGVAGVSGYGVVSDLSTTPTGQKATAFVQDLQLQAKLNAANRELESLRTKVAEGDVNALTEKANAFKDEMKRTVSEAAPAAQTGGARLFSAATPNQIAALTALVADMETRIDPASGDRYGLRAYADQIREVIDIIKGDLASKNEETMKARYGDFMSYLDARKTGKGALADATYTRILAARQPEGLSSPTQPTPARAPTVAAVDPVVVPDAPPPAPPMVVPPPAVIETPPPPVVAPAPAAPETPPAPIVDPAPAAPETPSIVDALASAVPSTAATSDEEINVLLGRVDSEVLDGLTPITVRAKKDSLRLIERDFRRLQGVRLARKSWPLLFASASQREDATGELERDVQGLVEGEATLWTDGFSTSLATTTAADIEAFFDLRFDIRALAKDLADKTGTPEVLKTRTAALVARLAALKTRLAPGADTGLGPVVADTPTASDATGVPPAGADADLPPIAPPAVITPDVPPAVAPVDPSAGTGLVPVADTPVPPPVAPVDPGAATGLGPVADTPAAPVDPGAATAPSPVVTASSYVAPDRSSQMITIHPQLLSAVATARAQAAAILKTEREVGAALLAAQTKLLRGPPRARACEFVQNALRPERALRDKYRDQVELGQIRLSAAFDEYAKETRGMTRITDDNFIIGKRQLAERRFRDNTRTSASLTTGPYASPTERTRAMAARDLTGNPLRRPGQAGGERIDLARLKADIEDAIRVIESGVIRLADQRITKGLIASAESIARQQPLTGAMAKDEMDKCRAYEKENAPKPEYLAALAAQQREIARLKAAVAPAQPVLSTSKDAARQAAIDRAVETKAVSDAARTAGLSTPQVPLPIPPPPPPQMESDIPSLSDASLDVERRLAQQDIEMFEGGEAQLPPERKGEYAARLAIAWARLTAIESELRHRRRTAVVPPGRVSLISSFHRIPEAPDAVPPSGAGTGLVPVDEVPTADVPPMAALPPPVSPRRRRTRLPSPGPLTQVPVSPPSLPTRSPSQERVPTAATEDGGIVDLATDAETRRRLVARAQGYLRRADRPGTPLTEESLDAPSRATTEMGRAAEARSDAATALLQRVRSARENPTAADVAALQAEVDRMATGVGASTDAVNRVIQRGPGAVRRRRIAVEPEDDATEPGGPLPVGASTGALGSPSASAVMRAQTTPQASSTARTVTKKGGRRTMRKKRLTSRRGKKTNGK